MHVVKKRFSAMRCDSMQFNNGKYSESSFHLFNEYEQTFYCEISLYVVCLTYTKKKYIPVMAHIAAK